MIELGVRETALARLDPGLFYPEPIAVEPQPRREREIGGIEVIAVARVARTLLEHARLNILGEPGIGVRVVALALIGGDGGAPEEAVGRLAPGSRGPGRSYRGAGRCDPARRRPALRGGSAPSLSLAPPSRASLPFLRQLDISLPMPPCPDDPNRWRPPAPATNRLRLADPNNYPAARKYIHTRDSGVLTATIAAP